MLGNDVDCLMINRVKSDIFKLFKERAMNSVVKNVVEKGNRLGADDVKASKYK